MSIIICAKLPYEDESGQKIPAELQADRMLEFIKNVVAGNPKVEVYLTYSANEAQSALLKEQRQEARARNRPSVDELALIQGSNQAAVCFEMAVKMGLREKETPEGNSMEPDDFCTMNVTEGNVESDQNEGGILGFGSEDGSLLGFNSGETTENGPAASEISPWLGNETGPTFFNQKLVEDVYPNIHLLPFTTMRYQNHKIVPATFGVLSADINYFQEVRSGPGHENRIIILWGNQDENIAIGGGISAHSQLPFDQSSLRCFKSTLQQELNESNIFNLNNPADVARVSEFISTTLRDPAPSTPYNF